MILQFLILTEFGCLQQCGNIYKLAEVYKANTMTNKYVTQVIPAQLSPWPYNGSFKHAAISSQQRGSLCIMNRLISSLLERLDRIRG